MTNRLNKVFDAIDEINNQDPNTELVDNQSHPKEFIYGQRMSSCLAQYWPQADEFLQIAVRAQHIKRWHIKRSEYPLGKVGYLNWRKALGLFHAELAEKTMQDNGYSIEESKLTGAIVRKEKLKTNENAQTLEDIACLVFLTYYFGPFAAKHSEEKIISIVQKTWRKMSPQGKEIALTLTLPPELGVLVQKALA